MLKKKVHVVNVYASTGNRTRVCIIGELTLSVSNSFPNLALFRCVDVRGVLFEGNPLRVSTYLLRSAYVGIRAVQYRIMFDPRRAASGVTLT